MKNYSQKSIKCYNCLDFLQIFLKIVNSQYKIHSKKQHSVVFEGVRMVIRRHSVNQIKWISQLDRQNP